MRRKVSQIDIARKIGLDRSTVSKILNRDPNYVAHPKTKQRVFAVAERLGYDFAKIRRPFRRQYGRVQIDTPAKLAVMLEKGEVFDEGTCVVRNISVGGALLTGIKLRKMVLPLANFTIVLRVAGDHSLKDLRGECEVVRLAEAADTGEPELGVRFVNLTFSDRMRLREYMEMEPGKG